MLENSYIARKLSLLLILKCKRKFNISLSYQNICRHSVAQLEIRNTFEMNFKYRLLLMPICVKIKIKRNLLCDDILSEGT